MLLGVLLVGLKDSVSVEFSLQLMLLGVLTLGRGTSSWVEGFFT